MAWFICFLVMELFGASCLSSGVAERFDFRSFYAAGYLARTHPSQLYDLATQQRTQDALVSPAVNLLAFYHPSYETLIYAPFSLLKYRAAYLAFIALNLLLLLAALFAGRPMLSADARFLKSWPWMAYFVFLPLLISVAHGQDSILLLLVCCLVWRQLERHKDLAAGCLLALALFKFQIVLPIALLIAVRRGWRFVAGFAAASAGVALLCLGIGGREGMASYLRLLFGATSAIDKSGLAQQRLSVFPLAMPNLSGFLYACGGRLLHSAFAFDLLVGFCALVLIAFSARAMRRQDDKVAFSIAILCGVLVSYHLYVYDLTPALLAVALLQGKVQRILTAALFVLPLVLLPFGSNSFFLLALPVLAMLIYTILAASTAVESSPATAQATI